METTLPMADSPDSHAVRERCIAHLLPSVMAAQAAIYASLHGLDVSANAPTWRCVVGAHLRGHDVAEVAATSAHPLHPLNEGHSL